jgi:hypothetical protein
MGAYGALNIGTKHPELFATIASLGGPVDMAELLRDAAASLAVQPTTAVPQRIGDPVTFDHPLGYPDRDTRLAMLQDLVLAFGNPFLHHPDPTLAYLAKDSEPARLLTDDRLGPFVLPADPRGFLDGGDGDRNGQRELAEAPVLPSDVLLLAPGSIQTIAAVAGAVVGGRALADLDGDGLFDVGDGVVVNESEPFVDADGDGRFTVGESFSDVGLDGVADSGDFGEGNGGFDADPDRAHWFAEDPLSRIAGRTAAEIATQRYYLDVGTEDEFGFAQHYANLVDVLQRKGLTVSVQDGFPGNCIDLPDPDAQFVLVRYAAGHVGVESVDPDDLFSGDPCGEDTIWQRIVNMIGYLNESFPDGVFGPGDDFLEPARHPSALELPDVDVPDVDVPDVDLPDVDLPDLDPTGDIVRGEIPSPALATDGGPVPLREILVYRPPAFFHSDDRFPIVYFLGGYGQEPDDYARIQILLDSLILSGQLQNMFFAFLPGAGGREGSFYVDHAVSEAQMPEAPAVTSGRYEESILLDLIPTIERDVAAGRVR